MFAGFERSENTSQKPNMHVIGKRSHPCYTMHVFTSSNAAKKGTFFYRDEHGDNFGERVWVLANDQMEWRDRQRGLGEISCRRRRINLTKREGRQSTTPKPKRQGRGRRVNS